MLFFGGFVLYVVRANMSVTIIAMVNATADQRSSGNSSSSCHPTAPLFGWNNEQQGLILSGFFYGYVLLQLPGGYLATRLSAKYVIFFGILIPAILSLITPLITHLTKSFIAVFVLRIMQGAICSMVFPSFQAIIGRWAVPNERSRMSTMLLTGAMVGNIVTFPLAGYLCKCGFGGGWPSVFYVTGILSIVWCLLWLVLVYDTPSSHPRISQKELKYIQTALQSEKKEVVVRTPWFRILTSWAVWACIISHVCNDFGLYILLTSLPTYLKDTQGVDIKSNGLLSAIPFVCNMVVIFLASFVTDFFIKKGFPVVIVRKVNTAVGSFGAAIFLVLGGYFGTDVTRAVVLVSVSFGMSGVYSSGAGVNVLDIAPRYAGVVMGIVNTAGASSGIVGPLVIKAMANAPKTEVDVLREQWREVFILAAEIYVFGAILFTVLASGEVQSWAKTPKRTPLPTANGTVGINDKKDIADYSLKQPEKKS
jgi:ACS family sodium-dependent inorganic phosphate cotransporter-like MFS transporter 5